MIQKLFQTKCPLLPLAFYVCALTLLASCNNTTYNSPQGYDLSKPEKMELGKVLNEISGIAYNTENNSLLAISDSKEKIIEINLKKQKLKDYTNKVVPSGSDIEDVVKMDSAIYMLASRGIIYKVPLHKDSAVVEAYPFWSTEKNEFETLYYDPSANGLIMLCKTCAHEKKEGIREAFRFDLETKKFDHDTFYTINEKKLTALLKDKHIKFRPSAAAINPVNNRLYILISADNVLAIANTRGQLLDAYYLNPEQFPQAEGIAFAPNGTMFITNEGKYGAATLQIFLYKGIKK